MRKNLVLVLFAILVALFVSCTMPETQLPKGTTTSTSSTTSGVTGTVKVTVPHIAPWMQQVLKTKTPATQRAFLEADLVDFYIYDLNNGDNLVTSWSDSPGNNLYYYSDPSADTSTQTLPTGSYEVEVFIYNTNVSSSTPVDWGYTDVNVYAGQTASATITCTPWNPTTLSNPNSLYISNDLNGGGEQWFFIPSYSTQTILYFENDYTNYYTICCAFDGSGNYIDCSTSYNGYWEYFTVPASSNGYYVVLWQWYGYPGQAYLEWWPSGA
ncbi:MAG: DUF4493 domain-containing protein [Spirochaetia bacterium]|jgi:hypothetical protein